MISALPVVAPRFVPTISRMLDLFDSHPRVHDLNGAAGGPGKLREGVRGLPAGPKFLRVELFEKLPGRLSMIFAPTMTKILCSPMQTVPKLK
jgi:hypothetical protein